MSKSKNVAIHSPMVAALESAFEATRRRNDPKDYDLGTWQDLARRGLAMWLSEYMNKLKEGEE